MEGLELFQTPFGNWFVGLCGNRFMDLCRNRFVGLCGNQFMGLCGNRFMGLCGNRSVGPPPEKAPFPLYLLLWLSTICTPVVL